MKLLLKILFFIIAIFSTNISEAKVVVFDNVVSKIIPIVSDIVNTKESIVILENEFGITCKSQCVLLDYRNWAVSVCADAAKTSTNIYKHSFKYTDRVRMRGVQDPVSHNFPYSFDDAILSTNPILKKNGYKMFQQSGTMNGKNGVFEIGLTKDGIIDHRFFRRVK